MLNQKGFGILEVLIAAAILCIVAYTMATVFKQSFSSVKSIELRDELVHVRDLVKSRVDCSQTLASQTCSTTWTRGTAPPSPYFPLKAKVGYVGTPYGATDVKVGSWVLRASCVNNPGAGLNGIVIQYARPRSLAGTDFHVDPLTGKTHDWTSLFSEDEPLVCDSAGSSPPGTQSSPLTSTYPGAGGTCEGALLTALRFAFPLYSFAVPLSRVYAGTATCPTGQKALSGGAECGAGLSLVGGVGSLLTNGALGGDFPGFMMSNHPTSDGRGWAAACCIEGTPTQNLRVHVICGPE